MSAISQTLTNAPGLENVFKCVLGTACMCAANLQTQRQAKVSFAEVVLCLFSQCAAWLLIELCSVTVDFHLYYNGTKRWPANSRSFPQGVKAG